MSRLTGSLHELDSAFHGRDFEMEWLDKHILSGAYRPIIVAGAPGIGKTALLRRYVTRLHSRTPLWLNLELSDNPSREFADLRYRLNNFQKGLLVLIDGADRLSDELMDNISKTILRDKHVGGMIFLCRRIPLIPNTYLLNLNNLNPREIEELFKTLVGKDIPPNMLSLAIQITAGLPMALKMLAALIRDGQQEEIADILRGEIYDLCNRGTVPHGKIITDVLPKIVIASDTLLNQLRNQPQELFNVPPRQCEIVIADLLDNMGF